MNPTKPGGATPMDEVNAPQEREMRITVEERRIIKSLFADNVPALKVLRKIFLPVFDPAAPIGQTVDLWGMKDPAAMHPDEAHRYFVARRDLIMHVESCILQLSLISKAKDEAPDERSARLEKDGSR